MQQKAKILIVDDEARICKSLATLLDEHGYDILTADSGMQALSLIEKNSFDIALLDHMLPDMLGHQLIGNIHQKNQDTVAIIMTGNASVDSAVAALRKGAYDYLRKPFEFAELLNTIQNALSQKYLKIENKNIHRKLAISQSHYRYLVDNSPDIIYTLDHTGHFTFINNSIEKLTGLKTKDVIGFHYSKIVGSNNTQKCKWIINERRTGSRTKRWNELQLLKFDSFGKPKKEILYAELQSTGMYKRNDLPTETSYLGTHGVIRDITEKKTSELKSNEIKAQLQRAEKMEAIGTLAGGVAHDLNNLLSSVVGYPELILMDMSQEDPFRDYILQIKNSGEKAAVIVKDLLTLARRGVKVSDAIDLDIVIGDCLTSAEYLELTSRYPDIDFSIHLNSKQHRILGSYVHLSKCLMNLLSNAAEAMPHGGKIAVSTQACHMDLTHQNNLQIKAGLYIKLVVSDSGVGISPDDMKKIFDPFYTKKRMGRSGTGLGMTIVWTTIKDHNGHIDIHSTQGKGTTFTLYFPVTNKDQKTKSTLDLETIKGHGQAVLVVDDILEQREIASRMLTAMRYTVACVATGEESLEYIKTNPVDLIILDMVLGPGFDGLDTYKEIQKLYPHQKVIIVSGSSKSDRIKEALQLGACQYIKKPYSLKTIGLAIHREMDRSESIQG
ncbi:MAG: response regulator [Proteobacteria bacterium]|nr:response regulator [Pseudomonadota bacterium]MBU1583619.1 response regulator [Pseudomonadota bacterium]MBU2454235.1 response regulator [Pseudomonadota bacterium]MBU2629735.1 response regulator [Pseudomonadota bacterium]